MKPISPKPIIARVVRTWCVPPGLTFALIEDVERRVWVVESCPVGTQFWTVAQAARLPRGARTRRVLEEVTSVGLRLEQAQAGQQKITLPRSVSRVTPCDEIPVSAMPSLKAGGARKALRQRPKAPTARPVGHELVGV